MKASQRRERERLRVEERKIEKERSQEGGEFADKQQFVTSAYRKRLQERAEEERLEREEAEREGDLESYCHFIIYQVLLKLKQT